jgi:TolA-binding protein
MGAEAGLGDECRGELVARARRGALSASEGAALRAHLDRCASCRLAHQVVADFAEMDAVDLRDDSRIERLAALARRSVARSPGGARSAARRLASSPGARRPAMRRAIALAAGFVLVAGTASAAAWLWPRAPRRRVPTAATAPAAGPLPAAAVAAAAPEAPPALAAPPAPELSPARADARPGRTLDRPTPGVLLREAGDAERRGRGREAVGLYRRLQKQFPASTEAAVAAIPLGRLLLAGGQPRAALAAFDRYLGAARAGALTPEALYGRAQALGRLGERAEEARAWRRLAADFPDSAYTAVARRRIAELE